MTMVSASRSTGAVMETMTARTAVTRSGTVSTSVQQTSSSVTAIAVSPAAGSVISSMSAGITQMRGIAVSVGHQSSQGQ